MTRKSVDWQNYYEINPDHKIGGLQMVSLKYAGQKAIADFYKQKYGINIQVLEHNDFYDQDDKCKSLYNKIVEIGEALENDQAAGLIFTSKQPHDSYTANHSFPYVIAKKDDKIILLKFFIGLHGYLDQWIEKNDKAPFITKKVVDFDDTTSPEYEKVKFQKDDFSCATFALNTMKNCLNDENFLTNLLSEKETVDLSKLVMGEGSYYIAQLSDDKKEKYVRDHEVKNLNTGKSSVVPVNFKAFHKAHTYARMINPKHMDLLDEKTCNFVLEIDRARGKSKSLLVKEIKSLNIGEKDYQNEI